MNRITISLTKEIEEHLRSIQGGLIRSRKEDVSFTAIVNLVLFSGIVSMNNISDNDWGKIKEFFMEGKNISVDLEKQVDVIINKLLTDD